MIGADSPEPNVLGTVWDAYDDRGNVFDPHLESIVSMPSPTRHAVAGGGGRNHASVGCRLIGLEREIVGVTRATRTRRRLLQTTAVTAAAALVAGCGGPGEDEDDPAAEEGTGNGQDREDNGLGDDEDENDDE